MAWPPLQLTQDRDAEKPCEDMSSSQYGKEYPGVPSPLAVPRAKTEAKNTSRIDNRMREKDRFSVCCPDGSQSFRPDSLDWVIVKDKGRVCLCTSQEKEERPSAVGSKAMDCDYIEQHR
ncbi:hypothetical protein NQZ68_009121 [Dissostichus eleginoides]|nr:hypothetical protein NQZ68_009121 [Dissostichus eleginoides]